MNGIDKQKHVICLMGPTAIGKTALALKLVKKMPCEIISVDSSMVYREMNIGTAKPTLEEQAIAPHQLIDICNPNESFSVAEFIKHATNAIDAIHARNKIPLLVGGTMLYFKGLQQGLSPLPSADQNIRAKIREMHNQYPEDKNLYNFLSSIDPITANKLSCNDQQRIQRAIEVFLLTGQTLSQLCQENPPISPSEYNFINIALMPKDRKILHKNIEIRIENMLNQGLIEEVQHIIQKYHVNLEYPAMRAVGYRQVFQYLSQEISYQQMQEQILFATRQLAKRQLVWLRSWQNLYVFDVT